MRSTILLLSCTHAVNTIANQYLELIAATGVTIKLSNNKLCDVALQLQQRIQCECSYNTIHHLLIDCSRSLKMSRCFSEYSKNLTDNVKQHLIDEYYLPFRQKIDASIQSHIVKNQQILHLSINSFISAEKTHNHTTAIGLSYDTSRHGEKEVARLWHGLLIQQTPSYRIRCNYPHIGSSGLHHYLRKKYPEKHYLGLEIEINQSILQDAGDMQDLINALSLSILELLAIL